MTFDQTPALQRSLSDVVAEYDHKVAGIADLTAGMVKEKENNNALQARITEMETEKAALLIRESKVREIEDRALKSESEFSGFSQAMQMVFRNTIVRESKVGEVVRDSQYWQPGSAGPSISPIKQQVGETTTREAE